MLILLTLCVTKLYLGLFSISFNLYCTFEEYNQDVLYPIQNKKFKVNFKKIFTNCRDSVWCFTTGNGEHKNCKLYTFLD